jgi:hypothetical protein
LGWRGALSQPAEPGFASAGPGDFIMGGMKQMVYAVYFVGVISGFILASILMSYEISKCVKNGKMFGNFQIIYHGKKQSND